MNKISDMVISLSLYMCCMCYIFRNHILKHCPTVAQEASTLIHSALDDPDIPVSPNELRWLGCNVYNLGCVSYQRDCFAEGVPLLTMACEELRVWCLAAEKEVDILCRMEEVRKQLNEIVAMPVID